MGVKDLYDGIAGYDIITIGQKLRTKADDIFRLEGVSPRILGKTANELAEHTITSGIASEISAPNGYGSTADITAVSPSPVGEGIEETVEAVSREGVEELQEQAVMEVAEVIESGRESSIMDYSNRFVDSLADDFNLGVEVRDVVKEDMILVQFSSDAPNASLRYWTTIDEASKAKLDYVTSNGLVLETTPNKATTVLRTYKSDTGAILDELGNIKSLDFGPRDGVFKNISKQN